MKIWMAIFLVILMIGVTPSFAADSTADQQTVSSTAIKQINSNNKEIYQATNSSTSDVTAFDVSGQVDENEGYIDGYDDDGNYIGDYIVVDPADNQPNESDNYTVSSFNMPDENNTKYIDESDSDMIDSESINNSNKDTGDDLSEVIDTIDENVDAFNASNHTDENDNFDGLNEDDQFDEDEYNIVTELDIEFEDNESLDADQLSEGSCDDVNELDNGNDTVIDPSDVLLSEDTLQIDTNVSNNCKPLIVTIVNGLCGVVQATLKELGNVCVIFGNELETIL